MQDLFSTLSHAIEGTPLIACGAAFAWGVLSIVLSPCHLASIPLIVGFIDSQRCMSTRRAFVVALLFAVGILITLGLVGFVTAAAGRILGDLGRSANYVVVAIFFVVGLNLLGVIPTPFSRPTLDKAKRRGLLAAFALGLVFGIALGPCSFAFMAPMLGVTFTLAATRLPYSLLLLLLYGIGHCTLIVLAGTFAEGFQHYLHWNEKSKGTLILRRTCGVLVLLAGHYMLYVA
ncbi:MAG: cytochrome c biogenesis protein CcdA [Kiritimatiellia bacterium]|jgi:cytochrome c-type biogenesis protein|nr:cytochrome c biogenesis protein CcdA [Kiritimatiellia bacterium]MDP6809500.1 cytochrome c biogenesis protein CcdA [Kiritimatiellia bacterium]MDP7023823.1 cytochrome c biogenesis protein CcdA [Kiritimatiellia bacterium]